MSNIVDFKPKDAAKNPDHVLEQAKGVYTQVLVLGWDQAGELDARASMNMSAGEVNWLIDQFKQALISGEYAE